MPSVRVLIYVFGISLWTTRYSTEPTAEEVRQQKSDIRKQFLKGSHGQAEAQRGRDTGNSTLGKIVMTFALLDAGKAFMTFTVLIFYSRE